MKGKFMKKLCAVSLSALMLTGAGVAEIGSFIGTSLPVSAAAMAETPASSFRYVENDKGEIRIIGFIGSEAEVIIPSKIYGKSVTSICSNAFSDPDHRANITSITIPNSITSIEDYAFYQSFTKSITIPNSITSIGKYAFSGCADLGSIIIPDSVTKIGDHAFSDCFSLTSVTISNHLNYLTNRMFAGCESLTSITIPDSVISLEEGAFSGCISLTNITIPNSVTSLGEGVFCNCTSLIDVTIPNSVASLGKWAFSGCKNLTNITIPNSVTFIGEAAFSDCKNLTSITIPNSVITISGGTFSHCTGLNDVTIPKSVTSIKSGAFSCCTSLTNITIPDSVISIGSRGLIGGGVFSGCTGLTNITIPNSVTEIVEYTFSGCTNLTSITIPDSVTYIGERAFMNCEKLTIKGKKDSYAETYANEKDIHFEAITFPVANKSSVSTNSLVVGKTVTVNAAAKEGKAPYTYAVWYQNPNNKKWDKAQDYSKNATVTVKPKQTGAYVIRVNVKDASGKVKKKDFTVNVFAALKNTSTVSATAIKLGKTVTVTAASTGGLGEKQYAVWYRNPNNGKWYKAQDYSANTTVTVKPKQTGAYIIRVNVKDERGKVVKKDYTVNVTK